MCELDTMTTEYLVFSAPDQTENNELGKRFWTQISLSLGLRSILFSPSFNKIQLT